MWSPSTSSNAFRWSSSEPAFKQPVENDNPLLPPEPERRERTFCEGDLCRIAVFLPSARTRWVKAFDGAVVTWVPLQRDEKLDGPNVRLRIVTVAPQCKQPMPETCNVVFRAAGDKLVETK